MIGPDEPVSGEIMRTFRTLSVASLLVFASLLLLAGCAGGRPSAAPVPPFLEALEVWPDVYRQNFEKIRSFTGKARLSVESEQFSGNVSMETNWINPERLFLKVEGPLGLDVGQIFVGANRFIWYNQYENHFISGSVNDPYLNRFMRTNITFADMKYNVLGYAGNWEEPLQLRNGMHGVFFTQIEDIEYQYLVNPETGLLENYEARREGRPFMRYDFKNYRVIDGIYVPMIIQITMIDQKERITIFYTDIVLNQPVDLQKLTIQIPSKVVQLNVNE